jgi:hypothetical protein
MLVLPGPGILVIVVGLAVLATEFAWAERTLHRTRSRAADASAKLTASRTGRALSALSAAGLILGGGVVVVLSDGYRLAGAATVAAGLCALAVLAPATRRWIDRPHGPTSDCAASSTLTATDAHGPTPPTAPVPPEATWSRVDDAPATTGADGQAGGETR